MLPTTTPRRRLPYLIPITITITAAGITTYYVIQRHRKSISRLFQPLVAVSTAASTTLETITLLSSEIKGFLSSSSDELPTSLRQLSKIPACPEFAASISRVSESVTFGILSGVKKSSLESSGSVNFSDWVVEKVLSDEGNRFFSAVAASFGRGLVHGFQYNVGGSDDDSGRSTSVPWWVELMCVEKVRKLIEGCVETFVRTGVEVYLEKTIDINTYDEIFAGLTNLKHEEKMKDVLVTVCKGSIEALVKTSHSVLTRSGSGPSMDRSEDCDNKLGVKDLTQNSSLASSTLAVPMNRRFVLDLTGRTVFEVVRAFLDFSVQKVCECGRRGAEVITREVAERGMEMIRFVSVKSVFIFTICLVLCMHIVYRTRNLVPSNF